MGTQGNPNLPINPKFGRCLWKSNHNIWHLLFHRIWKMVILLWSIIFPFVKKLNQIFSSLKREYKRNGLKITNYNSELCPQKFYLTPQNLHYHMSANFVHTATNSRKKKRTYLKSTTMYINILKFQNSIYCCIIQKIWCPIIV